LFSVSAKTQYAIRAMSFLARNTERVVSSAEIAAAEQIPAKYLEGIMTSLKNGGLVSGERGKNGGYRLLKAASDIPMLQIVEALDGSVMPVNCVETPDTCSLGCSCMPRQFWIGLKSTIDDYLRDCSLQDLVEGATHAK